ncbi:cellulose biosynthesis protein BcsP [Paraburkholderia sediminicola]|uniref:cellulose biosynthesis protein BcsP n=1 Tax=Paraburkholderia sediminicola TaxID=458836 RepID=UPI0038BC8EB9
MSSSSDIEKLFDHFGGDASAYQEIGRENEARSARTRWPLLVTLDLTQPAIPAIGQRREPASTALAQNASAADRQDTTPKDAASVTRAKAPLFTRSHRRDIPPVAVATQPAAPSGASRFGALETNDEAAAAQSAPAAPVVTAPVPPVMPPASMPPVTQFHAPAAPVTQPMASMPPNTLMPRVGIPAAAPAPRAATSAPLNATAPTWAQAPTPAHTYTTTRTTPRPPASILGKLFAPEPEPAPPQPAATPSESAPLQSVFDRLRGTPAQTAAAPASAPRAATPAASNSWLVNGPRRS